MATCIKGKYSAYWNKTICYRWIDSIAQWILKQNDINFDGIYEIKFNKDLDCIYYKSWELQEVVWIS